MTNQQIRPGIRIAALLAVAGCVAALSLSPSHAQTADDITRALQPKAPAAGLTRSMNVAPNPKAEADRKAVQKFLSRSIVVEPTTPEAAQERAEIASIAKDKPAIDLEILFDYNSDVVGPKAVPALFKLGTALSQPEFKGTVFLINGHTDAAGSPEYNLGLSHRRALSVRRTLIEQFRLAPETLIATGFGKEQLKDTQDPLSQANRRVQIVNTTVSAARQ